MTSILGRVLVLIIIILTGTAGAVGLWLATLFWFPAWQPLTPQKVSPQFAPSTSVQSLNRPFPVSVFPIGDVPVALPKDWVEPEYNVRITGPRYLTKSTLIEIHPGEQPYIHTVNVDLRLPPRSKHFELPPLHSFHVSRTADGAAERTVRSEKTELDERWPERVVDEDGFWLWKAHEYLLTKQTYSRPFDQPLTVFCSPTVGPNKGQLDCTVRLYWASNVAVRYDFTDTEFPKARWAELDQRVIALLDFLDGRKEWSGD
jgi:hypothetical protein